MVVEITKAFLGGGLIGLAAVGLLFFNGRIAGISGILGGAILPKPGEWGWRLCFILGLIAGGLVLRGLFPGSVPQGNHVPLNYFAIGGLLVGVGTKIGGGCTSGHGVCGIPRGSLRSLTATVLFMAAGFITVYLVRHVLY